MNWPARQIQPRSRLKVTRPAGQTGEAFSSGGKMARMGNAIRCSVAAVGRIERQRVDGELRNARAQLNLKDVVIETLESDRRDFAQ